MDWSRPFAGLRARQLTSFLFYPFVFNNSSRAQFWPFVFNTHPEENSIPNCASNG
jgi:hypothetical protein